MHTHTHTHAHTTETWRSYTLIETAASLFAYTKGYVYTFSFVYTDLKCTKIHMQIDDNAVQGRLSENCLTREIIARNIHSS